MRKSIILCSLIGLNFSSCSKDDAKDLSSQLTIEKNNLIGTWKSIEISDHSGSEFEAFNPIAQEDQYSLTFLSDDNFINTSSSQCNGTYIVDRQESELILNFEDGCSATQSISTVSSLTHKNLVLIRAGADEAFKNKFERL